MADQGTDRKVLLVLQHTMGVATMGQLLPLLTSSTTIILETSSSSSSHIIMVQLGTEEVHLDPTTSSSSRNSAITSSSSPIVVVVMPPLPMVFVGVQGLEQQQDMDMGGLLQEQQVPAMVVEGPQEVLVLGGGLGQQLGQVAGVMLSSWRSSCRVELTSAAAMCLAVQPVMMGMTAKTRNCLLARGSACARRCGRRHWLGNKVTVCRWGAPQPHGLGDVEATIGPSWEDIHRSTKLAAAEVTLPVCCAMGCKMSIEHQIDKHSYARV
jgi:hypothetical protein